MFTAALVISGFESPEKIPKKNVSAPETCSVTKYRFHQAVSLSQFLKKFKKAIPQSHEKSLMEMENIKKKTIMLFMILTTRY